MLHVLDHSFRCIIKESEKKKSEREKQNLLTFLSTYQKDHFTSLDVLPFTFLNYPPQTYHPPPEISSLAFSRSKTPSPKTSSLLFADVSSSIRAAKIRRAYGAYQNYPPLSLSLDSCSSTTPLPPFTKTPVILLCKPSNHKLYRGP